MLGVEGRPVFAERLLVAGVLVRGAICALPFENGDLGDIGEGYEVGVELGAAMALQSELALVGVTVPADDALQAIEVGGKLALLFVELAGMLED
jgi:hypothetical protein